MEVESAAVVRVLVPAEYRFIGLCRVAAASIGAELQFDVDQIEDLRIGVNELLSMLVAVSPAGSTIEIIFRVFDAHVRIEGANPQVPGSVDLPVDALTTQILDAVAASYGWRSGTFWLETHAVHGEQGRTRR